MKGNFLITIDYLKQLGACREGQRQFVKHFPDGGEYQAVLDKCADERRLDLGLWLLDKLGATDDVRVYEDDVDDANKIILFAGSVEFADSANVRCISAGGDIRANLSIRAGGGISAGGDIRASLSIRAGGGISAGGDIRASCSITAGGGIRAGGGISADWGIRAGVGIRAGENINAGEGYGIFAGLNVRMSDWSKRAVVTAAKKPENLMSGFWKEKDTE